MQQVIGPYQVVAELGRGGMGVVYRAHDPRLGRTVAIKALPGELAEDAGRLERFEREARVLAQLNHPNLAGIHGLEEHDGRKYLVLEFVEGETLAERLDRGTLPLDEAVELAVQIAAGIEAAHEAGIIHRDLKPANIILTPAGDAKVLDFGLARAEGGATSTGSGLSQSPTMTSPMPQHSPTIPGAILGTAAYMSPEQARGRRVDRRTDVWSFGVILYEMLVGASPFAGETASDSIGAVLHKGFDLSRLPPETPMGVRRVLERCIERDASLRYRDIGDVRMELLRASHEPQPGEHDAVGRRGVPAAITAGLALLTLAAGATIAWIARPQPTPTVVKADLLVATEDEPLRDLSARISPDGQRVAYILDDMIHLRDLGSFESRTLSGTEDATGLFWSPDSQWIGYLRRSSIYKVGLLGGGSIKVCDAQDRLDEIAGGAWTPDGQIVFRSGDGLMIVPASGGEPAFWLATDRDSESEEHKELDFHEPRIIAGTNAVVFVNHLATMVDMQIEVYDGTTRRVVVGPSDQPIFTPTYSPTGHLVYAQGYAERTVWAVGFDRDSLRVTGAPFQIMQNASDPSVAADGTLAVVRGGTGGTGGRLAWVDPASDTVSPIGVADNLDLIFVGGLSPDGTKVSFTAGEPTRADVWIADLGRKTASRLTFEETFVFPLAWSPDGQEIALAQFDPAAREDRVQTLFVAVDGSGETRDRMIGIASSFDARWASALIDKDPMSDDRDYQRVWLDGSKEPETVLADSRLGGSGRPVLQLSPDGSLVLGVDSSSGRAEVVCERIDGRRGRYQVSTDGGLEPVWSPDGSYVYYRTEDDKVMRVEVDRGAEDESLIRFGIPEIVMSLRALGLRSDGGWSFGTADGQYVAIMEPEEVSDEPTRLSVIANWFEEFRGR